MLRGAAMSIRPLATLKGLISGLRQQSEGSVTPMFALSLVPMIGLVGAAVEYSQANNIRTGLQGALDAAVLAAARDGTFNWQTVATNVFNANLPTKGGSIGTPVFTKTDDGTYKGSVS